MRRSEVQSINGTAKVTFMGVAGMTNLNPVFQTGSIGKSTLRMRSR